MSSQNFQVRSISEAIGSRSVDPGPMEEQYACHLDKPGNLLACPFFLEKVCRGNRFLLLVLSSYGRILQMSFMLWSCRPHILPKTRCPGSTKRKLSQAFWPLKCSHMTRLNILTALKWRFMGWRVSLEEGAVGWEGIPAGGLPAVDAAAEDYCMGAVALAEPRWKHSGQDLVAPVPAICKCLKTWIQSVRAICKMTLVGLTGIFRDALWSSQTLLYGLSSLIGQRGSLKLIVCCMFELICRLDHTEATKHY